MLAVVASTKHRALLLDCMAHAAAAAATDDDAGARIC